MAQSCRICNHPERLLIDREVVQGKSYQMISNTYNVSWQSVRNHALNHLTKQLCRAWERKSSIESLDLLGQLEDIITKAKKIFDRNYEKGRDNTALRALAEQRGTLDLLCKIAQTLYGIKAMEMAQAQEREPIERIVDLSDLTDQELDLLISVGYKLQGKTPPQVTPAPEVHTPTAPPRPVPRRPKTPLTTLCDGEYGPEKPTPNPTPAPEPEAEPEPAPARALPPRPTTIIPSCRNPRLARYLLGRMIEDQDRGVEGPLMTSGGGGYWFPGGEEDE